MSEGRKVASPAPFSLEDSLVASCGLAPAQAREVSKKALRELSRESGNEEVSRSRLLSVSNPDAIIALFAGTGLSRADIAAIISMDPLLLRASAKNIALRLLALHDRTCLSAPQIARFLLVTSRSLREGDIVARLEFFISFYGSFEKFLVVLKRSSRLVSSHIETSIEPNIALLHQWGVHDIARLSSYVPRVLITFNPEHVKEFLLRAEQLGVLPISGLFRKALVAVSCNSKEKVAAKLDSFKRTLGCLDYEVSTAVSKMPAILGFSDEILVRKIEFLVNEAAMEPRRIVERPVMLTYSLENRLVPRHYVMKVLRERGLLNSNMSLTTFAHFGLCSWTPRCSCWCCALYNLISASYFVFQAYGRTVTHGH